MISLQPAVVNAHVRPALRGRGAAACLFALIGCAAAQLPAASGAAQAQAPAPDPRSAQSTTSSSSSVAPVRPAPISTAPATNTAPASAATGAATNTPPVSDVPTSPTAEPSASETQAPPPASPDVSPAVVAAEERRQIVDELGAVETQLEMVDQRRADGNIAGPVAMLATGYTTGLVAMGVSLASFAMAEQVEDRDADDEGGGNLDINNDGAVDGDDEATYRRVARGLGVASAVGFAVGIAGNVILGKRLKERRAYDPEIRQLQRRRRDLRRELEYGGSATPTGLSLALGARF